MQVIQKHKPVILLITAFSVLVLIGNPDLLTTDFKPRPVGAASCGERRPSCFQPQCKWPAPLRPAIASFPGFAGATKTSSG